MPDEDLRNLLIANQQTLLELKEYLAGIKRQMIWAQVFSVVKIILIIAPIIWGFYFLSPMLKNLLSTYQGLGGTLNSLENLKSENLESTNFPFKNLGDGSDPAQGSNQPQVTPDSLQEMLNKLNIGK